MTTARSPLPPTEHARCPNCGEREHLRLSCVGWLAYGSYSVEISNGLITLASPPRITCTVKPRNELVAEGIGRCHSCGHENTLRAFGIAELSMAFYREPDEEQQRNRAGRVSRLAQAISNRNAPSEDVEDEFDNEYPEDDDDDN